MNLYDVIADESRLDESRLDDAGVASLRPGRVGLGVTAVYPAAGGARLTRHRTSTLADHLRRYGPRPVATGPAGVALIETLEAIRLTGRGGGHFSADRKWRAVLAAGGGGTLVANGAEGEPASAKDAALLELRPHLVLDGLALAAEVTGARTAVVWLHEGAWPAHAALLRAVAERQDAGLRDPAVTVRVGPDRYLAGESSAVLRALSGGPALPEFRQVPAAQNGLDGRPTLLHNVETLARVAIAARTGSAGYSPTSLVTVLGHGRRTVIELPGSTTIAGAVAAAAALAVRREGPADQPPSAVIDADAVPQAVLVGGYGGSWLRWDAAARLPLRDDVLRAAGAGLGAGVLAPLPAAACGLLETAVVADYLARSSARQCGSCLFGLRAIADELADLVRGEGGRRRLRLLERHAAEVDGQGACHHPDGAVRLIRTALATFTDDLQSHLRRGRCLHPGAPAVLPVPAAGEMTR
jgi:NADH:ubiquinone oxidoreductase subunit F (NADH-binding)